MRMFPRAKAAALAAGLAVTLIPVRLNAQTAIVGGLDKLLDRVETADLYYGWNKWHRKETSNRYSITPKDEFGLEFSFHVGSFGDERPWEIEKANTRRADALRKAKTKIDSAAALAPDPDWKARSVTIKNRYAISGRDSILTAVDSEFVAAPNEKDKKMMVDLDFAIGYGQLDVRSRSPYETRGYVRELPSVSMYITRWMRSWIAVYAGARTGIITLQDGQVFVPGPADSVRIFGVSATSLELGGAVGAFIPLGTGDGAPDFTIELSPMWRNFNSLVYSPNTGTPKDLKHQLDMSGATVSVGIMFPLGKK